VVACGWVAQLARARRARARRQRVRLLSFSMGWGLATVVPLILSEGTNEILPLLMFGIETPPCRFRDLRLGYSYGEAVELLNLGPKADKFPPLSLR
jgi:hypothetical protein